MATYAALGACCVALIAVGGVIWRLADRLNKSEAKAKEAADKATMGVARIIGLEKDLVEHRVAVAREYVSTAALARVESALTDAINGLGDRLDRLFFQNRGA